ncbi:carboxypeptidase B-like [Oratosquilla oratoria]|uniref:carboxypeptidase B-like n=1 Tax=Oratosquilla oratoria TaxID=337810 RepID=UPI003F768F4D
MNLSSRVRMKLTAIVLMALNSAVECVPLKDIQEEMRGKGIPRMGSRSREGRSEGVVSYKGYKLFEADVRLDQLPVVDSLDTWHQVDVWSWRHNDSGYLLDVLTTPSSEKPVVNLFDECSVPYRTVIGDLQTAINEEIFEEDYTLLIDRGAHRMSWTKYHNFDDMNDYLKYLEQFYPDRVTLINIGQSFEKRNMTVIKITNGSDKKGKKAIWLDGGMHAREWVSPATLMFMVHRLTEFQSRYKDVFEDFDWYILPLANPDGYEYSMNHDRLWRKTRSVHQAHNGTTCVGVDPNRNFGYKWRTGGSSDDPCSDTYAGPSPFSESETQAIRDFLLAHKDVLELFVTFHAYSQMWMMPWASSKALPSDYEDMKDVALKATAALKKINGTEYMVGSVTELLYVASGSSDDFAKGVVNIPYTYSVELRDRGRYGFILPPEYIEPTAMETLEGMLAMTRVLAEKKKNNNSNKSRANDDLAHDASEATATSEDLLSHEDVTEVKSNTVES